MKSRITNIRQGFRETSGQDKASQHNASHDKYYMDEKYGKISGLIREKPLSKSQFDSAIQLMNQKIYQKKVPYRLKKDYQGMKFLITYNQRLNEKLTKKVSRMRKLKNYQKGQNCTFEKIDSEIKSSTGKVKKSQFIYNAVTEQTQIPRSYNSNLITEEARKVRTKSSPYKWQDFYDRQIRQKIDLFNDLISEEQRERLIKQIGREVHKLNLECPDQTISHKMRRYIANHIILQKFLRLVCQNSNKMQNKHKHRAIYNKIKAEMVSIRSNEECFMSKWESIRSLEMERQREDSLKQTQKTRKTIAKKIFYNYRTKENELIEQIQKIFSKSKEFLTDAYQKRGKQIQLMQLNQIVMRNTLPEIMVDTVNECII